MNATARPVVNRPAELDLEPWETVEYATVPATDIADGMLVGGRQVTDIRHEDEAVVFCGHDATEYRVPAAACIEVGFITATADSVAATLLDDGFSLFGSTDGCWTIYAGGGRGVTVTADAAPRIDRATSFTVVTYPSPIDTAATRGVDAEEAASVAHGFLWGIDD